MFNGGFSDELQRILLTAAIGQSLQRRQSPSAFIVDSAAFGGNVPGGRGPIMIMSIPGVGLVGTGLPPAGIGDEFFAGRFDGIDSGGRMPDAFRSIMHMMTAAMEASMETQQQQRHSPPASELLRDALPRVVVTKEDQLDSSNSKCAVCLDDYKCGTKATRMLCGHLFCTTCIREWLRQANSCPVCRFELATEEEAFEAGRIERMRGRRTVLKNGDLKMMGIPDLKKLMRALGVSGDGCVEKHELIRRVSDAPFTDVMPDRDDIRYEEDDLDSIDISALRNLMERHGMPKLSDDLSEMQERVEALKGFEKFGLFGSFATTAARKQEEANSLVDDTLQLVADTDKSVVSAGHRALASEEDAKTAEAPKDAPSTVDRAAVQRRSSRTAPRRRADSSNVDSAAPSATQTSSQGGSAAQARASGSRSSAGAVTPTRPPGAPAVARPQLRGSRSSTTEHGAQRG